MRGRNGQAAFAGIAKFLGNTLNALGLVEDFPGLLEYCLPGGSNPRQVFAIAGKDLHPQLVFEHANLLTDTGLRGKQALCSCRDVHIVVGDFPDIPQLLQFHCYWLQ